MTLTGVVEGAELVKEGFDSHGLVAKVLHVDLSCALVDEVDSRSWHAHPTDSVHAFYFLEHTRLCQFFIEGGHAVLLSKAFFNHACLPEKLAQENPALSTLLNQGRAGEIYFLGKIVASLRHFSYLLIIITERVF